MSGRSVRRIAVLTPLPPTRSGIATYNHGFLPQLGAHLPVTAFVDDRDFPLVSWPDGVEVRPVGNYDPRRFDLTVFHMGNHVGYHEYIHEALCATPGLVVLHDMRMTDFFRGLGHRRPDLADATVPRSRTHIDDGRIDFGGLAPIFRRARGVLVHSSTHAATLRRCFPTTPVFASRLALPVVEVAGPGPGPELFGWPRGALVVGAFGSIGAHKRIDRVIATVAGLRTAGMDVRLIISGWVASGAVLDGLESMIARFDIEEHVRILTDTTEAEMSALHRMCDAAVDLRDPYTGASSLGIATALGHGLVTIATALPEFTDLSHPLLRHVPPDEPGMSHECARILGDLARGKALDGSVRPPTDDDATVLAARHNDAVVADHIRAIDVLVGGSSPAPAVHARADGTTLSGARPVTVMADIEAANGLMEYGRALINALHAGGAQLAYHELTDLGATHDPRRDTGNLGEILPRRRDADTEIWFANINEFPTFDDVQLRPPGTNRRIIASWFWELPVVQEPFLSQFARVDEIWVGSPFVARTFRQYCDHPIIVVPMPIEALPNERLDRGDFGLNDDEVCFYFDFDLNSHIARKNPLSLIEAFRRAFRPSDRDPLGRRPRLVLKAIHMGDPWHVRSAAMIRDAMSEVDGIIIDDELDRRDLDALVGCCDVYVSLHRAEGLGIGMLEAMHLGKPVISPTYPHKWLFAAGELGLGVRAAMRTIDAADTAAFPEASIVYSEGLPWVEPDIDDAARHMRRLFDDPAYRTRLGERAARLVREHYNTDAALRAMAPRLASSVCPR